MTQSRSKPQNAKQGTVQPQTQKNVKAGGPPGENSSKASAKGQDGRSAQDKDGNEAQGKLAGKSQASRR
mgnify:CR=1 FL=1